MKTAKLSKFVIIFIVMTALFIPAAVFADDDYAIWVGGVPVSETGAVTGEGITGNVYFDAEKNVLTLSDATITGICNVEVEGSRVKSCIYSLWPGLTIEVKGNNIVGDDSKRDTLPDIALNICDNLDITGDGRLEAHGDSYAIWADKKMDIYNVTVDATSLSNAAISSYKGEIKIDESNVIVKSKGYEGLRSMGSLTLCNSIVMAIAEDVDAINAYYGDINIIDSYVDATSWAVSEAGYVFSAINSEWGRIRIANSAVNASANPNAAISSRKGIELLESAVVLPVNGKVASFHNKYTVLDEKGVPSSRVRIFAIDDGTMAAAGKNVTLKSGGKKLKKAKTISKAKAYTILKPIGKVTFKKVKANKSNSKFKVDSKTGKITVKKGTKNGTYKLTVKITDPGDDEHSAVSQNVVVKIKIKKK